MRKREIKLFIQRKKWLFKMKKPLEEEEEEYPYHHPMQIIITFKTTKTRTSFSKRNDK